MRYEAAKNLIHVHAEELAKIAKRGISSYQQYDDDGSAARRKDGCILLSRKVELGELHFLIEGSFDSGERVPRLSLFSEEMTRSKKTHAQKLLQAEAFILAAILAKRDGLCEVEFETELKEGEREPVLSSYKINAEKLESFFSRCIASLALYGRIEIERVTKRLPSMKAAKFPYGSPREGQSDFIHTAYRAMASSLRLYAEAPTGTGKTVSALFPAIRAIGKEKISKAFYLTPKATTAIAAKECLELFTKIGVFVRSVIVTAKDKVCIHSHVCRESKQSCPTFKDNKLSAATLALCDLSLPCASPEDVRKTALEYGVCPYELSLCYAELCDIIICDFNYLFDPDVYFRRFFDKRGDYVFLVDEAHNLPERAREMYSAKLSLSELRAPDILGESSDLSFAASDAIKIIKKALMPLIRDEIRTDKDGSRHAAYHTKSLPAEFFSVFSSLYEAADGELFASYRIRDEYSAMRTRALRDYCFKLGKFKRAIERFDDAYELFVFLDNDEISLEIFCLDTGSVIDSRLDLGSSAVLFSGTLSPLNYYKSVLGADRTALTLEVDSPFDTGQLSVNIINTVTTRISEREKSLGAIISVIGATLSAKRGNYMIFSPSFAYSKTLFEAFRKKYPKIHAIYQSSDMSKAEKDEFLASFSKSDGKYLVAFCVMGGIFSEGIDLVGDKLIGSVIVGIGMPALSFEREAIAAYYADKLDSGVEYAYLYPGMNRVLQAAGRVIRTEEDRGVIVLIDDRFNDPLYKKIIPSLWSEMRFLPNAAALKEVLDKFWKSNK